MGICQPGTCSANLIGVKLGDLVRRSLLEEVYQHGKLSA